MRRIVLLCALLLILTAFFQGLTFAQYWSGRALEKSFEQTDFFFTPSNFNPYGIGNFKTTTPGLMKDPLLDLIVNRARLGLDSAQSAYLYTDFRSARNVEDKKSGYYPPWYSYANARVATSSDYYYPRVYLNTRRELEPVFSGALIARPIPSLIPDLIIGGTYQLVLQDDLMDQSSSNCNGGLD